MSEGIIVPAWVSYCGVLAPIASICLNLAPMTTILEIYRSNSVGEYPLLPYSSMFVNAFVWVVFGILQKEPRVWISNGVGMGLGLFYSLVFSHVCPKNKHNLPGKISHHLRISVIIVTGTFLVAVNLPLGISNRIIGMEGVLFCLILFASPLSVIKGVIRKRSARSIPLPFTIACFINCCFWSIVGLLDMKDFVIYFPNVLGVLFSIVQIWLKFLYGNKISKEKDSGLTLPLVNKEID